jgi:DnaJ-class molecular chaperone
MVNKKSFFAPIKNDIVKGNKHNWIRCPACHGSGMKNGHDCNRCAGIGRVVG